MRFPSYPSTAYPRPARSAIEGYVDFFAENEADNRHHINNPETGSLRRIAMRIGRACLIASHNSRVATATLSKARRELAAATFRPRSQSGREAAQLDMLASMLEHRDQPEAVLDRRVALHTAAVNDIRDIRAAQVRHGNTDGRRGNLAQRTALGLLTRYAHPYLMATPALTHHDRGSRRYSGNYDILLVESMPGHEVETYKLQVKCGCLGLCTETGKPRITQSRYDKDVTLVSACCDMQRGDDRSAELLDFRAADLLVRELDDDLTDEEVHELDSYTDSLILSVTMGDERRMGTR